MVDVRAWRVTACREGLEPRTLALMTKDKHAYDKFDGTQRTAKHLTSGRKALVFTCSVHLLDHTRSHEADVSVPVDDVVDDL